MNHQEYNGWTNYETWNVALWLDNEQGSSDYWNGVADELLHYRHRNTPEEATSQLAEQLKNELEESAPDLGASCFADLLNAALNEVNWYEIAEHYIDAAKERLAEETETETK